MKGYVSSRDDISGLDLFRFLAAKGYHICESIGGDIDNVVMSRDCDDFRGYVGVPVRQPRLASGYLKHTLDKVGLTLTQLREFLGD